MVKVLGKIKELKKSSEPVYRVKRKNRTNSFDCITLREYGQSFFENCSKTCDLLNNSYDNVDRKNKKNFSGKAYFYFPTLA